MDFMVQRVRILSVLGVLLSALAAVPVPADNGHRAEVNGDLILMQGKWKLVDCAYYYDDVMTRPPEGQRRGSRVVTGNKYHLTLQIGLQQVDADYTFKLFPDQKPKGFDVTMPDGRIVKGIYEVNGHSLRRCYTQPDTPRPARFQAGTQTYQVWKRVVEQPAS